MQQEINELEVNGVKYVKKDSIQDHKQFDGDIKIVVLQRGWIYIGRFERIGTRCRRFRSYWESIMLASQYLLVRCTQT